MTSWSFRDFSNIFKVQGSIDPHPPSTHTYNSQYHSHHHRNHHIREGLISVLSKTDQELIFKIKSLFHATVQDNLKSKTCLQLNTCTDDLRFYVVFNSISVMSERCEIDNENQCAMELRLWMSGDRTRSPRSVGQRLTLWATGAPYFLGKQLSHVRFASIKRKLKQ